MITYYAIVEHETGGGYRLRFPDFPEIKDSRRSLLALRGRAHTLLREEIRHRRCRGGALPDQTTLEDLKRDARYRQAVAIRVRILERGL